MTPALQLRQLTKRYDDGTLALDSLDLEVPSGSFFGLLGPNGAGKTTLISAVCNLIRLTDGEISVFGEPGGSMEARRMIGIAEQEPNLDRFLTVHETLVYHGGYYGMSGEAAAARAEEMIDVFDLRAKRDTRAPKLSGGMRRRLLLARALLHEPRLVILDEPTAGVDLELRHELWRYIRRLHERGTTILLTTHYLEEAEALCEEIALIGKGRIMARDTADGLKQRFDAATLEDVYMKTVAAGRREVEESSEEPAATGSLPLHEPLRELAAAAVGVEAHHEAVVVDPCDRTARPVAVGARAGRHSRVAVDGEGRVAGVEGSRLVAGWMRWGDRPPPARTRPRPRGPRSSRRPGGSGTRPRQRTAPRSGRGRSSSRPRRRRRASDRGPRGSRSDPMPPNSSAG